MMGLVALVELGSGSKGGGGGGGGGGVDTRLSGPMEEKREQWTAGGRDEG